MTGRKAEDIAKLDLGSEGALAREIDASVSADELEASAVIHLDYPRPTSLSSILQDVARWSQLNFVVDPGLERTLQIFAPRKLTKEEAFQLFVASLETIGLRALLLQGNTVKIVPAVRGRIAV